MPFSNPESSLMDIVDNIIRARAFVQGVDYDVFAQTPIYSYAAIRALEIISEASRRLPDDMKNRHPDIPWKQIAGSGNIFRHDYEDVLERIVWDTIHTALGPLETAVQFELTRLRSIK